MKYRLMINKKYSENHSYFKNSKLEKLSFLLNKYTGFEGEVLFYYESNQLDLVEKILDEKKKYITNVNQENIVLLFCVEINNKNNLMSKFFGDVFFVGYDYGIILNEDELYSSILHEILFGKLEELKGFKSQLNDNYLFSEYHTIEKYLKVHNRLLFEGKDVEIEDDMKVFEVWKFISCTNQKL